MLIFQHISGRNALFCRLTGNILITLLVISALVSSINGEEIAPGYPDTLRALLEEKDSLPVTLQQDSVLEQNSPDWLSLIERGRAYLKSGNLDAARACFTRALLSKSARVKCQAHIGLGDCYRKMELHSLDAICEYRLAIKADSTSCEALYKLAMTGFNIGETQGYRIAARELANLLCIDPGFSDTYRVWRDSILDKTPDEFRKVHPHLIEYMAAHPGHDDWWLDIATDRYRMDEFVSALLALDTHQKLCLQSRRTERGLMRARCLLALGDTIRFERYFQMALDQATEAGDFAVLLRDTETIFSKTEQKMASGLIQQTQWRNFFISFWKSKDPDPVTQTNERLIEHYSRLHVAQRYYKQLNPHSKTQTRQSYNKQMSVEPLQVGFTTGMHDIFWGRSRRIALDNRGLMYVRHGSPHRIEHPDFDTAPDPTDIWQYGGKWYVFKRKFGAGDYFASLGGNGNFLMAMNQQSFDDPLPPVAHDQYMVDFFAPDSGLRVEFYHAVPADSIDKKPLFSQLAVYNTAWTLVKLDTVNVIQAKSTVGNYWWAVHSARLEKGGAIIVLRMEIPGRRAIIKHGYNISPIEADSLELSGIALGVPPETDEAFHSILGVGFVPRPSLKFKLDEVIRVYLEVYGLQSDKEVGRIYLEAVTIRVVDDRKENEESLVSNLWHWGRKRTTSLTMNFSRRASSNDGPVPETFDINSSLLMPGNYELLVTVKDHATSRIRRIGRKFELVE